MAHHSPEQPTWPWRTHTGEHIELVCGDDGVIAPSLFEPVAQAAAGGARTGRAIDVRLPGVALADLREAALSLRAGGVGYYPGERFVHLDNGQLRRW